MVIPKPFGDFQQKPIKNWKIDLSSDLIMLFDLFFLLHIPTFELLMALLGSGAL